MWCECGDEFDMSIEYVVLSDVFALYSCLLFFTVLNSYTEYQPMHVRC